MISASDFLKGNTAKSGSSPSASPKKLVSAAEFVKSQPVTPTSKEKKPTLGGSLVRGIIKTPAKLATNLIQAGEIAVGKKPTTPFSGSYLGQVNPIGQSGNFRKDVQESIGAGLEMASYIPIARGVSTLKNLAKEGAVAGFLGSSGSEIANNAATGEKISGKNIGLSTLGGAIAGPILGAGIKGLKGLFGKSAPITAKEFITKVNPTITPGLERPARVNPAHLLPAPRTPEQIPIELPAPGILKQQELLRNKTGIPVTETNIQKSPEIIRAEKFNSKQDFINNERQFYIRTKQNIPSPKTFETKLSKVWDEAHKTPEAVPLPKVESYLPSNKKIPNTKETIVEPTNSQTNIPQKVAEDVQISSKSKPEEVTVSSKIDRDNLIQQDFNKDPQKTLRIALGKESPTNGVPSDSYLSYMKKYADDTNNAGLIDELSNSNVSSTSGSKLGANIRGTTSDIVREIKDSFREKIPSHINETSEVNKFSKKLREALETVVSTKPTKEAILQAVDSLICK